MENRRQPKKRRQLTKRRQPNTKRTLEYAVTAKDSLGEETIKLKAKEHSLNCFRKGHAKNRLYFRCTEESWNHFYGEVKHLCLVDGPGRCPAGLQKKMLKNLHAAAHSRIDLLRAERAKALLAIMKRTADQGASQEQAKTDKVDARIRANEQPLKSTPTVCSRRRNSLSNAFRKCVNHVRTFVSRKKHLQPANS